MERLQKFMRHFEHLPVIMGENVIFQFPVELVEEDGHGAFLADGSVKQLEPGIPSRNVI